MGRSWLLAIILAVGLAFGLGSTGDGREPPQPDMGAAAQDKAAAPPQTARLAAPAPQKDKPAVLAPPDQEPAKWLELARSSLALGRNRQALEQVDRAAQAVWQRVPLSLNKAILVREPAKGYGIYQARANDIYLISGPDRPVFPGKGMPIYVYLEPIGYRVDRLEGERFAISLSMDVALLDAQGKPLFSKNDFMKNHTVSHHFNREFFLNVTVSLKGAPPGKYKLLLTVKDKVGGQKVQVKLPIQLAMAPREP
jgi:hypothetical protein